MNEINRSKSLNRIKVNKKLIKKKSGNNINKYNSLLEINNNNSINKLFVRRNSFTKKIKIPKINLGFDNINGNFINKQYSQRTYSYNNLSEEISYKKGNIIYDMQNNKYLKPVLNSKEIYKKLLKCKMEFPYTNLLRFNKNCNNLAFSKTKDSFFVEKQKRIKNYHDIKLLYTIKSKKEKRMNKLIINILERTKENNSLNCKNNLGFDNLFKRNMNNSDYISLKKYLEYNNISKTCRNCGDKINYQGYENNYNSLKMNKGISYSFKSFANRNKLLKQKIESFCNMLEMLFINIIKKEFKKFLYKLKIKIEKEEKKTYQINRESKAKITAFYESDTGTYQSNNEIPIKANINFFNIYDKRTIIKNQINHFDKNNLQNSKNKGGFTQMNNQNSKTNKNNLNIMKNFTLNKNKNEKNKKILIKKTKNNIMLYQKKNYILKNYCSKNKIKERTFNKTKNSYYESQKLNSNLFFNNFEDSIKKKSKIFVIKKTNKNSNLYDKDNKLTFNFKYYSIEDMNYKNIYNNKYKNKRISYYDYSLYPSRNINYFIKRSKISVYKKIKLNYNTYNGKKNIYIIKTPKNTSNFNKLFNIEGKIN